jgi:hypothetical protein
MVDGCAQVSLQEAPRCAEPADHPALEGLPKIASTVRYLGIEVGDAIEIMIADKIDCMTRYIELQSG